MNSHLLAEGVRVVNSHTCCNATPRLLMQFTTMGCVVHTHEGSACFAVIVSLDVDSPFILLSNYASKFPPLVTSASVGVAESHVAAADSPDLYDLQRDSGAGCFA